MWQGSSALLPALQAGAQIVAGCQIWSPSGTYNGVATEPVNLSFPVQEVDVTMSRSSQQRGQCTVTVAVDQWYSQIPTTPISTAHPLSGQEVRPLFGVVYPVGYSNTPAANGNTIVLNSDGTTTEWVPMGVFPIVDADIVASQSGVTMTLDCYDRSWVISQRALLQPFTVNAGDSAGGDIQAIINSVYPGASYNIDPSVATFSLPSMSFDQGADPWASALQIATAAGAALYCDRMGVICALPVPNPQTTPVTLNLSPQGNGGLGMVLQIERKLTRDNVYNDVYVSASGTGSATSTNPPVQAEAADTNPASPTYVYGPLGDIPEFISSTIVTTTAQAQAAADNELMVSLGGADCPVVTLFPLPIVDIDDVVQLYDSRIGLDGAYVVDEVQMSNKHNTSTVITLRNVA